MRGGELELQEITTREPVDKFIDDLVKILKHLYLSQTSI